MAMPALAGETVEELHARLMSARRGDSIEETLARMLASWACGQGAMPAWLGLGEMEYRCMMACHFPGIDALGLKESADGMDPGRLDEMDDLKKLLLENRSGITQSEIWMADILVAGCMGSDHLWQDLGLWSRSDLSRLMMENFEPLAKRNDRDMKWKKFLYKQLCETEGIYTCRSPSCEVCVDYDNCFGSEG
ncbi:MAG: nitrogen fixation protein NifQ [Candidatus Thiodiazotropha sp.]